MTTYKITAQTPYGKETLEEDVKTREEANYLADEYRLAFRGMGFDIKVTRSYKARKKKETTA